MVLTKLIWRIGMNRRTERIMGKNSCKVNLDFVPIKFHYFLYNGALAGVIPFLPVIAMQLGISPAAIGVIYAILPFLSFIGKPFFGCIADNLHKLKPMLMLFLLIIMCSTMGINFIPPLATQSATALNLNSSILCSTSGTFLWISGPADEMCMHDIPIRDLLKCSLRCFECVANQSTLIPQNSNIDCQKNSKWNVDLSVFQQIENNINAHNQWEFEITNISYGHQYKNCSENVTYNCNASCIPDGNQCGTAQENSISNTFQFWTFFVLAIAAWVSCGICVSLSDAACFNILKDKGHLYGQQRLWGTIGWGCFAALAGYLIHKFTSNSSVVDHAPGFYILFGLMFFDLIAVYYIQMDDVKVSKSILKDVASLLVKPSVVAFIFAVFIVGALTGILWSFLFLHLKNLGAQGDLLGFASGVQCIGELPFFFFSGWLISKIGHSHTLAITLASFGIRFIAYSQLSNPWWVLPIELLQGLTFGAFYPAMASYASIAAPPGTEVTMQGLVGGAFEGLGMSVGGLLGGMAMHYKDGETLFLWAGIGALVSCCLHILVNICLNLKKKKSMQMHEEKDVSPNTEEITSFL